MTKQDERFIISLLMALQARKSQGYGDSWRRRGEYLSVFGNVARKWDRIETLALQDGSDLVGESLTRTVIDFCVYCILWLSYLYEKDWRYKRPVTFKEVCEAFYESNILGEATEFWTEVPEAKHFKSMKSMWAVLENCVCPSSFFAIFRTRRASDARKIIYLYGLVSGCLWYLHRLKEQNVDVFIDAFSEVGDLLRD